jgi:hypothetical protein
MDDEIPPFLTVEEAGRLLRIGRTKAYDLAREWRATDGRSGLPVIDFGDLLRVPGPAIRQMLGVGVGAAVPAVTKKRGRPADPTPASAPASPASDPPSAPASPASEAPVTPVPLRKARPRRALSDLTTQLPLFQPLPFASPDPEPPSRP